jgi:hypothetical protein
VPLFEESIAPTRRTWLWLVAIVIITFLAIAPFAVPIAIGAWLFNVLRYRRARVRIDEDRLWVGKRSVQLAGLDLRTLDRAGNTWPWQLFNRRWLGANPIWTHDSVAVRGIDGGRRCWVAVGTNRRDELVEVLERAVPVAQAKVGPAQWARPGAAVPPPGWHPDPWAADGRRRWWDGNAWTGYTWPSTPGGAS